MTKAFYWTLTILFKYYDLFSGSLLSIWNFNNIITNKYGLGEAPKHASLIEVNGNIGASSIAPDATDASVSIPIEIQTMDDVIGNIAEKITFIKIDVAA